jgi:hypothetical protein
MKKTALIALVVLASLTAKAQVLSPVTWSFSAVKVSDKMYEIHMKATIQNGWHLYSQTQPDDAVNMPTEFTVNPNPLFTREGKIKEIGKMEVMKDATLGISANQYSTTVDFVQKVKMKAKVKTNFTGNVEYQTCDDKKCLPPKKVNFSVVLQ